NPMRAFSLIAMLLGIQILFAFLQGDWGSVVSDLLGFVTGFALSFVLIPGGWALLLQRLRKR
ncbi:MAG: rhomboid family intramembrane serine protease, partial [Rhodobacteraceae bacterium]|nr:rhomboid family intramembrane serine protease [Paracoccaceae bacterium]